MKVLIIDDDALTRQLLSNHLGQHQFVPYVAENGFAALEVLRANNDITKLLLDANMPGMNAFEMMRSIQEDNALCQIDYEIHIISSWDKEYILEKMTENGIAMKHVRNIMRKPIDMQTMTFALSI